MRRAKISSLPKAIREWLETALVEKNFGAYEALAAEANEKLAKLGYSLTLSKSGLHRYGSNLERRLSAIKASTEAAALIAKTAPDDADHRSAAVISLVQTEIFETLVSLQEAEAAADPVQRVKLLSAAAKNIATLSRASVNQKRHELELRTKVTSAADRAMRIATKGGISKAGADELFRVITGIAA